MLNIRLRIILIIFSIFFLLFTINKIAKKKMLIGYSIFWFLVSFGLIILSIFPKIGIAASKFLGLETPVNLMFLLAIISMCFILIKLMEEISSLKIKVKNLTQELAIKKYIDDEEK